MDFLRHLHSGLRWVVILLLLLAIVNAFRRWKSKADYNVKDKTLNLFAMISLHTQVLIGLILYVFNGNGKGVEGLSNMDVPVVRFFAIEHIVMMVLAAVVLTIGRKRAQQIGNHRKIWIWYGVAFIIIMAAIPWPFLEKFKGITGYF